jgi:TPR repeat protein
MINEEFKETKGSSALNCLGRTSNIRDSGRTNEDKRRKTNVNAHSKKGRSERSAGHLKKIRVNKADKIIAALAIIIVLGLVFSYATTSAYDRAWYYYNKGNYEKAVHNLVKSAEEGNTDAEWDLGCLYCYGDGVAEDDETAVYWFTKAAEEGGSDYQYNLAWLYYEGDGLNQDYEKAYYWFSEAATRGDTYAMNMTAEMLLQGYGVIQNPWLSIMWYNEAANKGDIDAICSLIDIYENGIREIAKNRGKAEMWKEKYKELTGESYCEESA